MNIPQEKIQMQAQAGNPIVAQAKKEIPGKWHTRWDKTKKFIKRHQQTIYLTLDTLGTLAIAYWYYKRGLSKLQREYYQKTGAIIKDQVQQTGIIYQMAANATDTLTDTAKKQISMEAEQKILNLRLEAIESAMNDPRFKEYLAKKHGITNVKPL